MGFFNEKLMRKVNLLSNDVSSLQGKIDMMGMQIAFLEALIPSEERYLVEKGGVRKARVSILSKSYYCGGDNSYEPGDICIDSVLYKKDELTFLKGADLKAFKAMMKEKK